MGNSGRPASLVELRQRVEDDLLLLNLPMKAWVISKQYRGQDVLDVAVVGGGICGMAALAALRQVGISNVECFDRARAGEEGPWITYARMNTLRTRKESAGLSLGIPSLTFRAWYEAQHGRDAFERMEAIPRQTWMDYLIWYRATLDLPVRNETSVRDVEIGADGLVSLTVETRGQVRQLWARRVILATGIDGLGGPALPDVANRVPRKYTAHAADDIDMAELHGKRVVVVGLGSSAMDNAAAALEAGASRVDIFGRRKTIPGVDKFSAIGHAGAVHGFVDLPDADRWALMVESERMATPPPRQSILRVSSHGNAFFHFESPILDIEEDGNAIVIVTPKERHACDFVIFATGFSVDFDRRPEFSKLARDICLWRDVYRPEAELEYESFARYPYLGRNFEFLPKPGKEGGHISHAYCFSYPAVLSHGKITSGVPSINEGATRLAEGIASSIFVEDRTEHIAAFRAFERSSLTGDEWSFSWPAHQTAPKQATA